MSYEPCVLLEVRGYGIYRASCHNFKRTKRLFENSDYESFGIINEKCELINTGALLADYPPVRHSHLFCTRWNELDKANGMVVNF